MKHIILEQPLPQVVGSAKKKTTAPHFWRGGTLGAEQDVVVIPISPSGHCFYPIIDRFVDDIAQLSIEPGARLVISGSGRLTVDGLGKKGIGILNEGELVVMGELTICRTKSDNMRNRGLIQNAGSIAFDQPLEKGLAHKAGGWFEDFGEII
jgi:hypothetical protein